jgi:hypothetical protein
MARFWKRFGMRRSFGGGPWSKKSLRDIYNPPLPMGADPSFECPESSERVTYFACDTCPLYQRWGDSDIRSCKHEYEKNKALEEESRRSQERTIAENKRK